MPHSTTGTSGGLLSSVLRPEGSSARPRLLDLGLPLSNLPTRDSVALVQNTSRQTLTMMVRYLTGWSGTDKYARLYGIFGREALLFMSDFEGDSVQIPSLTHLLRIQSYCDIYVYLEARGFTPEAYEHCAALTKKKPLRLHRIVADVSEVLSHIPKIVPGCARGSSRRPPRPTARPEAPSGRGQHSAGVGPRKPSDGAGQARPQRHGTRAARKARRHDDRHTG